MNSHTINSTGIRKWHNKFNLLYSSILTAEFTITITIYSNTVNKSIL